GDRSRAPHRTDQGRHGVQARGQGNDRREDPPARWQEARAGGRRADGGRRRREEAHAPGRRRSLRVGACVGNTGSQARLRLAQPCARYFVLTVMPPMLTVLPSLLTLTCLPFEPVTVVFFPLVATL